MTTGVFLLSPAGIFADANAQAIHSNGTLTANGSVVLSGFGNQECHLVVNVTVAPTGVLPTLQFVLQEVDPGDLTTLIGAPITGSVLTAVGTDVLTLPTSATSAVQVSWIVTGAGASFTGVFATFVSKLTSPKVEGLGTPGTPTGGVVSIQGVLGGQPLPVSGTVMATNPSVAADGGPAPAFSTQVGGSDGVNLQAARIHDLDTGVGSEYDLGVSIRLPSAGGSVAGGTGTDPIRVDPTGTTTQPISATALPLPTGAATEATLATRVSDATVIARLNTLGQKAMAASAPVVIASDQSAVPIAGSTGAGSQEARVHDLDTGVGTEYDLGVSLRLSAPGGSVEGGTAAHPVRVDPTGTTTQPISATALPLPTGAATEATLATRVSDATIIARLGTLGQKTMAGSAPVVIASDQSRVPVSTEVQADYDTGVGTQELSLVGLGLPSAGGAVAGGTSTNPIRVDPTGTTTQPISAVSLPLPTGAATQATLLTRVADATITARLNTLGQKVMATSAPVVIASDQSAIAISSAQLPAALVGGRLDINLGSWLGSVGPTTGQKTMVNSLPVVIASDQTPIPVSGTVTATNPSVSANAAPIPGSSTQIGGSDGINLQAARVHDLDTGVGAEYDLGVSIRLPSVGGSVAGGTGTNPLRTDPTGTTTQPISATSLPLPTGAATEATLATRVSDATIITRLGTLGQKTMAGSAPMVIASDQTAIPISGTVTATNPSVGAINSGFPGFATQIGASDGANLRVPRVFDADTGGGLEFVIGTILRKSASGGSVEAGTATDPLRVDPTGTTTQPISSTQLPAALVAGRLDTDVGAWLGSTAPTVGQKAMASSVPVVVASNQSAIPVSDGGGSLTIDTTQLPAALVGGRLDINTGSWLGSTAPTVGQKTMANSIPVVISSDQTAIPVSGSFGGSSVGPTNTAVPSDATQVGGSDGTKLQALRVFDVDTGVGTQFVAGVSLRKAASGGSVEAGTSSDPLRVDPTGTTTQPISATSLPLPTGAATEATLSTRLADATFTTRINTLGQKTMANSTPVVLSSDQSAIPITDNGGSLTIDTTQLPAALVGGRLDINVGSWLGSTAPTVGQKTMTNSLPVVVASDQSTLPVSGTVTANIGTTGGLALDATLTGGTQKAIVRGGAKGATVAADVTSTAEGADHQALDVQIYSGGVAKDPTQIRALTNADVVSAEVTKWIGSTAPTVGQKAMASSLPVVIASDQSPVPISGSITATNPSVGPTNAAVPTDATQIGGSDGTNLQAVRVFDVDTGVGTQFVAGVSLRKAASGGSVEAGTSADPLRVDPTGTTTQPVSDGGGSLTIDTTQLPAALVGGRLDINVGAWLGSTAPTVGQKTSANSIPVVLASDQSAVAVSGTVTANQGTAAATAGAWPTKITDGTNIAAVKAASTPAVATDPALVVAISPNNSITASNPSVGVNNAAAPGSSTQIGGTDGTNLQSAHVFDADTGVGTEYVLGSILRKSASGGSVEAGTATDPLRIDPTGTTAQPVTDNGGSLTVDTTQLPAALVGGRLDINVGAWLGSTAPTVGQKTSANSVPVVIASDQSAVAVSGTVTANIGTTGGLALDATLTGGTAKAIVRGGTKGATVPADVTSTAEGVDHQALDVQIYHGGVAKDPTQIRALTNADVVSDEITKWIGSTAPTVGQKTSANSLPVVIASDQSAIPVTGTFDNGSVGATGAAAPAEATQVGGTDGTNLQAVRVFDADSGAGTQYVLGTILRKSASGGSVEAGTSSDPLRVDPTGTTTQPVSDGGGSLTVDTTQLPAALVGGRLDINVGAWLGSTAPTVGQKTSANSLPVVIASDQSAVSVTLPANQSVNLAQVGGTTTVTGGVAGSQGVGGLAASGAALAGNPVLTSGSDGTNARTFATDSAGIQYAADLPQAIARGRVSNAFAQSLFGEVTTGASTRAAINATAFTEQTAGAQRSIKSTSASDTAAGTGARTVKVTYFTLTGLVVAGPFTETLTLNGTTAVDTVATDICFVEKIEVITVGSTGSNVGTLNFFSTTAGGGSIIVSVAATDNLTKLAHHYVPTGRTCMIYDVYASNSATSGNTPRVGLEALDLGTANAAERQILAVRFDGRAQVTINPSVPIVVVGPARINAYVTPTNNASQVTTTDVKYVEI